MTLNPAYEALGKTFVEQYYAFFDDQAQRANLINLYNVSLKLYLWSNVLIYNLFTKDA